MSIKPILPGARIGVLGSGQLGRMLALSARNLGYDVAVYSPEKTHPLEQSLIKNSSAITSTCRASMSLPRVWMS